MKFAKDLNDHLLSAVKQMGWVPLQAHLMSLSVQQEVHIWHPEANVTGDGQSGLTSTCVAMTLGAISLPQLERTYSRLKFVFYETSPVTTVLFSTKSPIFLTISDWFTFSVNISGKNE